jgi:NTE family protein
MNTRREDEGQEKLAMVLSGGGGRGAFEAGVMQRLSLDPRFREPDIVTGTSAGAINAALFACGKSPEQIRDFWFEIGAARISRTNDSFFEDALKGLLAALSARGVFRALASRRGEHRGLAGSLSNFVELLLTDRFDLTRAWLSAIRPSYLIDLSKLRARLVDCFGGEIVPRERCSLAINAVDACTNRVVRYVTEATPRTGGDEYAVVNEITVDMVLASLSIPILFPAIRLDRRLLWDGGVLSNTPLAPAVALGAQRIVTVLVAHDVPFAEPAFDSLAQALGRLVDMLLENAYNVDRQLLLARNRIVELTAGQAGPVESADGGDGGRYRKVRLYEAIRPARDAAFDASSLLDFGAARLPHLYRHGQSAAAAWLRNGPREDDDARAAPPQARASAPPEAGNAGARREAAE